MPGQHTLENMLNFLKSFFRHPEMPLISSGKTDIGQVRKNNEDNFGIDTNSNLFIVADGMGGHNAGEVASRLSVETIRNHFSKKTLNSIRGNSQEIRHAMISSFQFANDMVMKMAVENENLHGMGCTLVLGLVDSDALHTCHVGDARCYIASGNGLQQLTTDHTTLVELQKEFGSDHDFLETLPTRNVVTRVIGYPFPEPPEYNSARISENDRILFCSDGLWSMVDDQMIYNTLISSETPEDAVTQLLKYANDAGGTDNITGVAVFVRQPV
ncbi:MAG: protein phosphatase 2C domain-containing protein [Proteobacteria bacterium]|nr:protein phosphatase 2C domain-containing protein [Pseudomonadota bacterium]MBU1738700.1 protein phosphatase 2C domain-containing protein [Pseudomonadota bacterium]